MGIDRSAPRAGSRDFFGEVAIIVLGVMIALALGQVAQEWNDSRNLKSAETAIRTEIADNYGRLDNRRRSQPCIDRRLDEIAALLDAAEAGSMTPPRWIGRPQVWTMNDGNWQAAAQSGRASLLEPVRQGLYTTAYSAFENLKEFQREESLRWARLRSLENRARVDVATIAAMRETLSEARFFNWRVKLAITQLLEDTGPLDIDPVKTKTAGSNSVCLPIATPRSEALKLTGSPYGEP